MKPVYIVISALLFFVTSCKKDKNTADSFQLTVGNTSFTFDSTYAIVDNGNPSAYFFSILGKDTKTNTVFFINAQSVPKNNLAGTYSNSVSTQLSQFNKLDATLIITTGSLTGTYSTSNHFTFTLEIDNPGNDRLQGNFRGLLELTPNPNPGNPQSTDIITGQFKIPFKFVP